MSDGWYRKSRDSWELRRISTAMKNDVLNQPWGYASLDAPLADGTTHTLHDRLADHSEDNRQLRAEWASRIEWVQNYIAQISNPLHAAILEGRFLESLLRQRRRTIASLAAQYGKTPKRIYKLYQKLLEWMQQEYDGQQATIRNAPVVVLPDNPAELVEAADQIGLSDRSRTFFLTSARTCCAAASSSGLIATGAGHRPKNRSFYI